jgi:peptidyl-prolyl cis-trans isomerase D
MLAAFRVFAKSWVAALLIGVLIVAFAVWGIRDVFSGRISDSVITAGSRTISSAEFKREFDQQKSQLEQQYGQPIPTELAASTGLDRQVLEGLATREAFAELVRKLGLQPSDKLVVSEIEKIPAFFDPVSGRFDRKAYAQRLADNGMTVPVFEGMIRDELAQQQLAMGLASGLMVPRAYAAMAAVYGLENRDVAAIEVQPSNVAQPAPPTDAQLTAFMKELGPRLLKPEYRQLSIVRFSPDPASAGPVNEAEVLKRYNFRKDTLSKPETRTVVQIPAKDAATAAQITARLAKGEAPDAIAKSLGVAAITYPGKPQTAIADRKVAATAFQMTQGQVQTVQGDLGQAVVRVDQVTPGHQVTLEEIRPALEAEVRKDAAAQKVDQLSQAYDDAHTKGANLAEAAQKAGVPVVTVGPVAKNGADPQGRPVPGLTEKIIESAFGLPAGGESELVDAGNGEYFAVRADKVIPPAMRTLEEVRPELTRAWLQREFAKRMQAKAEELAARVKKGESLEAVAASAGAKVTRFTGLNRQTAGQDPNAPQELLAQTFSGKQGDVFTAQGKQFEYLVGKIESVRTGDPAVLAQAAEQARPQMSMGYLRELEGAAHAAARQKVKVRVNPDRARAALGLEPATATKSPAGKASLAK